MDTCEQLWSAYILCHTCWVNHRNILDGKLLSGRPLTRDSLLTTPQTIAPLAAEVAGLREVPSLLSLTWLSIVMPTAFAEVIALYLRRQGKLPYLWAQVFAGLAYCISSLFLAEIWRRKRKAAKAEKDLQDI